MRSVYWAAGVIATVLAAAAIVQCSRARAHEFYDTWCCSGRDCTVAPPGSVTWTPAGWSVSTATIQTVVPFNSERIRHNPPNEPGMRLCEYPKNELRCLYVPEPEW